MIASIQSFARRAIWADTIDIAFRAIMEDGKRVMAEPLVFKEFELGVMAREALSLDMTSAQRLMDELWGCGLRPTEGSGSAGSLAATERHLADMRKIAFDQLGKDKP